MGHGRQYSACGDTGIRPEAPLDSQIEERTRERERLTAGKQETDRSLSEMEEKHAQAAAFLAAVQAREQEAEALIEAGRNRIIGELNERAAIKTRMGRFETMLEQIQIRRAELNSRLLRAKSDEEQQDTSIHELEEEFNRINEGISALNDSISAQEEKLNELRDELAKKDLLNLDCMTVTGKTIGENIKNAVNRNPEVIRPIDNPYSKTGGLAVLKGNLAPDGSVVKRSAVVDEMMVHSGPARVFDCEEDALNAVLTGSIRPGDAVIIRYEGPKGSGMPEMFYTTEAIASDPLLASTIALLTDGRFSGASKGPAVGHISPEAAEGGPIALVEDGDLIELDIDARRLAVVGIRGERRTPEEIEAVLKERKTAWKAPKGRYSEGVLKLFSEHAVSPMKGGYME